jgi:hypothetical protein
VVTIAGKDFGLFGSEGFFLTPALYTPGVAAMFLFQMVFMDTAATIPTGALAERWRFLSFGEHDACVCRRRGWRDAVRLAQVRKA